VLYEAISQSIHQKSYHKVAMFSKIVID